jgi:uncharacterized protein
VAIGFRALPRVAAFRILGEPERQGFEVAHFEQRRGGVVIRGTSLGSEDGKLWSLRYVIELDAAWRTRSATIESASGERLKLRSDGNGRFSVDGKRDARLDGCFDLDLEASLVTNTMPAHRLALRVGQASDAPAAYVRSNGLEVERLEQRYARLPDDKGRVIFDYESPRFGYRAALRFARDGLVVDYPHIGTRVSG